MSALDGVIAARRQEWAAAGLERTIAPPPSELTMFASSTTSGWPGIRRCSRPWRSAH